MPRAKFNIDLHASAYRFSAANLSVTDPLTLTENAVAHFKTEGNEPQDYGQWSFYVFGNSNNGLLTQLRSINPKLTAPTYSQAADAAAATAAQAKLDAAAAQTAAPAPAAPAAAAPPALVVLPLPAKPGAPKPPNAGD